MPKKVARTDKLTGELLKNQTDFYRNRSNLVKHFQSIPVEEARQITIDILSDRKERKSVEYALYSTELKTIVAPSIALLEKIGIDYHDVCREVGLKHKFRYKTPTVKFTAKNLPQIIIDTREQTPVNFEDYKTVNLGLKVGDYCDAEDVSNNIVVERKALGDFISTLSGGYERFQREIERGIASNTQIVILVEYNLSKSISFNYLPQCRFSKCRPEFIFSRLRELMQKYTNIQFLFVNGRTESERVIPIVLSHKSDIFKYDLQLMYERRVL